MRRHLLEIAGAVVLAVMDRDPVRGVVIVGALRFSGIGQTERERLANSFLPRSMIRAALKSFTRPWARSTRPRVMSACSAASMPGDGTTAGSCSVIA